MRSLTLESGLKILEFDEHFGVQAFGDLVETDKGRMTDGVEDAVIDGHGGLSRGC